MGKVVLKLEGVTKDFSGLRAVDSVDLTIEKGSIVGIVGPNGAGKTTLFNMISGIFPPSKGKILFNDRDITGLGAFDIAILGIGRTFQVVRPFSELTVLENILVAYGSKHYGSFFSSLSFWKKDMYVERVREFLEETSLWEFRDRKAKTLPLGHQRRLEIARVLALSPSILLMDESFSGLNFDEMDELKKLVRKLNGGGLTIIIIEHNMPVVMELCERVAVLNYGKKIAEGAPEEVVSNQEVIDAYIGTGGIKHAEGN
ncbi:MAG: ABC transporter ATP-binding protein [Synergistetes bacterium]|nr:ABC transporter ATP-binding protein [Synergistota bacterium]